MRRHGLRPQANRESTLALRLLEQFLQAGVDTEHALVTLSSALALRGEEAGGFTTIDLLQVDLFTGDGVVFKLGAAPTYVRKGGTVRRIVGAALPAGLSADQRTAPDRFPLHLSPGDCVLMVSDGVAGTGRTAGSGSASPSSRGTAPRSWPPTSSPTVPRGPPTTAPPWWCALKSGRHEHEGIDTSPPIDYNERRKGAAARRLARSKEAKLC